MQQATPQLGGFRRLQQSIGNAFGQTPGRCVECHTEHEGPQRMVATPQQGGQGILNMQVKFNAFVREGASNT